MDENVGEVQPQNNIVKTNSKFPALLVTALIVIIVLLLLLLLYLFFAGNKTNTHSTTAKQSVSTQKPKTNTSAPKTVVNTNSNNTCKPEGTATSAMFPINSYPNQPSSNTLLQDQNTASKNWENNAYLVTSVESAGITAGPSPNGAYIYASSCTKDLLIYYGTGSGPYISPTTHQSYEKPVIVSNIATYNNIIFNYAQLPYNTTLPLSEANNFPSFVNPHKNGPIIYNSTNHSNPSSTANNITISNKSFYAQEYTVQINNSKKLGIFYDVMFYTYTNKIVALATISNTGNLLTLKIY